MAKDIRLTLLFMSLLYFSLCVAGGLEVNAALHSAMIIFFILFGLVVILRYLVLLWAAVKEKGKTQSYKPRLWTPAVSVIVPAFNEENLIDAALTSLARLDYPNYEIIVVDDGSTDGTACIARQVAARHRDVRFTIISQSNSGKAWALNTGIIHAQGELILCVDSDSQLNPQALKVAIHHFEDPLVGAVGGYVDIINDGKLLTRLQQLEYVIGLNFLRRALSFFNMVTIVPGPVGIFRIEAIRQAGGFKTSDHCFAEDADLTVRMLVHGWRVKGETLMIAHTEAPDTLYQLLRQRYRWKRGLFQAWFDNVHDLLNSPTSKGVAIAVILTFESFMLDIINFGITLFAVTSFLAFGEFKIFLWVLAVLSALDLIVFIFTHLEHKRLFEKFGLLIISKISYAYILQAWGVFALFDEWTTTKMIWDKLERIGNTPLKN